MSPKWRYAKRMPSASTNWVGALRCESVVVRLVMASPPARNPQHAGVHALRIDRKHLVVQLARDPGGGVDTLEIADVPASLFEGVRVVGATGSLVPVDFHNRT